MVMLKHTAANVNHADKQNNTNLHFVIWCSEIFGQTRLHKACEWGDVINIGRLVYECSDDVNAQNNGGDTPLHEACSYGYSDVAEELMAAVADVNITIDMRRTPAQKAAF